MTSSKLGVLSCFNVLFPYLENLTGGKLAGREAGLEIAGQASDLVGLPAFRHLDRADGPSAGDVSSQCFQGREVVEDRAVQRNAERVADLGGESHPDDGIDALFRETRLGSDTA